MLVSSFSDQMGNKGAFIVLDKSMKPQFVTYEAVVSLIIIVIVPYSLFAILASSKCKADAVC